MSAPKVKGIMPLRQPAQGGLSKVSQEHLSIGCYKAVIVELPHRGLCGHWRMHLYECQLYVKIVSRSQQLRD
jgi:hypothetical protein